MAAQDAAGLATKYAQALEQVKRHRDEVASVLAEAKGLERENAELRDENQQLRQRNTDLETHAAKLVGDYGVLEAQVKSQQLRLQQYIDTETEEALRRSRGASGHSKLVDYTNAARPATLAASASPAVPFNGPTPGEVLREREAEIEELKKRVAALDESRLSAASAAETYRESAALLEKQLDGKVKEIANLRREFAKERHTADETIRGLHAKEVALQALVDQLREKQARADTEAKEIGELDSKAKEGIRMELMQNAVEVDRLTLVAELAQSAAEEAKVNQGRLVEQMEAQRRFINDSNELAAKEMKALHIENAMLLEDLKTAVEERDAARKAAARHMELLKKSTEAEAMQTVIKETRAAVGHITLDRATQTAHGSVDTDVPPPPPPPLDDATDDAATGRSTSHGAAYGQRQVQLDLEAMRELELAVTEWRSIAEGTKNELNAVRSAHRKEIEDKAKEMINLGNKAQEIASKLKSAYAEIDSLTLRLQQALETREEAPREAKKSRDERDERPTPRSVSESKLFGPGSELQRLAAGGGDDDDARNLERSLTEANDCLSAAAQSIQETLVAAVQTHLIFTAPLGLLPSPDELARASDALPEVPCVQFRDALYNQVLSRLGGLRHLIKSLRTEVWAAAKRSSMDVPGDTSVKFKAIDGSIGGYGAYASKSVDQGPASVAPLRLNGNHVDPHPAGHFSASQPTRSTSVPPPPPPRAEVSASDDDDEPVDDLQELLRGNSATLASLTGQLRWESARMDAFRAQVDRLRSVDDE